jgi:hypothetical protein
MFHDLGEVRLYSRWKSVATVFGAVVRDAPIVYHNALESILLTQEVG